MNIFKDKTGEKWSTNKSAIAREWQVHPGTMDRYIRDPRSPKPDHKKGWKLSELRTFIMDNYTPNHRLIRSMNESLGIDPSEGMTTNSESGEEKPDDLSKRLTYKSRIDRARALKMETEFEMLRGSLIHIDVFRDFFADLIPKTVTELRRQMENVLPAILEGMSAGEIRRIHRSHIDKVLERFEQRAAEFQASIQSESSKQQMKVGGGSEEEDEEERPKAKKPNKKSNAKEKI